MYLDLLTNSALLDPQVWASADTWTNSDTVASVVDFAGKKKKSNSGLIIGGICCLVVIAMIVGGIYLLTKRKKQQ